jgi:hypothetical protein
MVPFAFRGADMDDFPAFMKSPANRIATSSQATPGVEGYVFDGADGSQMAFWTCRESAVSTAHVHDFDEYLLVVQGCYTADIDPWMPGHRRFSACGFASPFSFCYRHTRRGNSKCQ